MPRPMPLSKKLAEEDYLVEAERMQQAVDEMNEAVKQHGWDGEWFLRAYDFFGNKIGSDENEEGKILRCSKRLTSVPGWLSKGTCSARIEKSPVSLIYATVPKMSQQGSSSAKPPCWSPGRESAYERCRSPSCRKY